MSAATMNNSGGWEKVGGGGKGGKSNKGGGGNKENGGKFTKSEKKKFAESAPKLEDVCKLTRVFVECLKV